ncbi:MAG: protein kinase, partial [Gammaproteobacteria bacterium]|nr:protein kinase [Gammaproteobacteria bacterium]
MRVIIIDNSKDYMTKLRHMFAQLFPDVEVTEYDPEQGRPEADFNWETYDMLCIADQLCAMESGIAWLVTFGFHGKVPPTLFMAASSNAFIEEKVRDLSNTLFALKPEIDVDSLKQLVAELGVGEKEDRAECEAADPKFSHDRAVVATMAQKAKKQVAKDTEDASYRFVRLIGQGAHSRVYLAERDEDKLTLVLKVMDLEGIDDPTTVERFAREAELLSAIDSPYVVKVYDHGFTQTYGYTAVEFFTRGDLKQRLE